MHPRDRAFDVLDLPSSEDASSPAITGTTTSGLAERTDGGAPSCRVVGAEARPALRRLPRLPFRSRRDGIPLRSVPPQAWPIGETRSATGTPHGEMEKANSIWEDEYDIWLNGIASSGSNEVMIWTYNNAQAAAGSVVGSTTIGGVDYTVWATSDNSYIAFVADTGFTSGTLDLSDFFSYLQSAGRLSTSSVLGQIEEGIEMVSTNSTNETFTFRNFSITTMGQAR